MNVVLSLAAVIALLTPAVSVSGQPRLPKLDRLEGDKVWKLLEPDAIPAIDDPVLVKASEAGFMSDSEPVIGVALEGEARAYSVWHLDDHEIVNDRMKGSAIAVTW